MTTLASALVLSGTWAGVARASDQLGYVANERAGTISQVNLSTGTVGTPIPVGSQPVAIAITPDGSTAYVADAGSSQIVPVSLATGRVGQPIGLSDRPAAIAITPNGRTAYVISDDGREWPITLATSHLGNPTTIPANSNAIAIAPPPAPGLAYITNVADGTLTPLVLSTGVVGQPIDLTSSTPDGVAITPDGATAYITSDTSGTLTPLDLTNDTSGTPIVLGAGVHPSGVAISPDGSTAYVTAFGTGQVIPITLSTGTLGTPIPVGPAPSAIALVPAAGVTDAPLPGGSGGTGGTGGSTGVSTTLGNQQLTFTIAPPSPRGGGTTGGTSGGGTTGGTTGGGTTGGAGGGTTGATSGHLPALTCHAPNSMLRIILQRHTLARAGTLRLRFVAFRLGRTVKRARRLPAVARFPLRRLRAGMHLVSARVVFTETVLRHARQRTRRLTVTVRRTLRSRFRVC